MRLVDDDREVSPAMLAPDLVEDERKLLDRRDDDLLALRDELAEIARMLGVSNGGAHLGELLDRVSNLPIEDAPIGDDDDRVKDDGIVLLEADHLVCEPGDRVRLAASGRVLN